MTKTDPVEHFELTIGPAAVFCLAATLRQPPLPAGEFHSQFSNCSPGSPGAPRQQRRLYLAADNGETAH